MPRALRIEISRDLADAAYFVMASWRNPANAPCFDSVDHPPALLIDQSPGALEELFETLRLIAARSPAMTNSVAAFLGEIERQRTPILPAGGLSVQLNFSAALHKTAGSRPPL